MTRAATWRADCAAASTSAADPARFCDPWLDSRVELVSEHVMRHEEEASAEALDLKRARSLVPEAVPEASRRQDEERRESEGDHRGHGGCAEQRLAPTLASPDVGDRDRREHHWIELRRDRCAERDVPEAKPSRDECGKRGRGQRGRPEIEAREDDWAEREWGERDEGERSQESLRSRAEREQRERDADDHPLAEEGHQRLEPDAERLGTGVAERGNHENGQRARRVFDREVAVRHLPVVDRRPVTLVDGRVHDRVAREMAAVQHPPGHEEEHDRNQSRR